MSLLFNLILITSIWCIGLTIVTQNNMLLHSVRIWAESKESKWYAPLILCTWCLPSIHSAVGYGFAVGIGIINSFSWRLVFMYPLVVMGASFVTGIVWSVYELISIKTQYYTNIEQLSYFDLKERKKNYKWSKGEKVTFVKSNSH